MAKDDKKGFEQLLPLQGNKLFYGIFIALIGAVLLGVNLGFIDPIWIDYWPTLLIIWGLVIIM